MKTYKDLSLEQELEYILWLSFFKDFIDNALVQIKRWNRSKKSWDLEMFFMAVSCIDDAVVAINKFLNLGQNFVNEPELNNAFKEFRKKIKNHHIKDIRNDLIHRGRLSKQQDKKGNSLPRRSILVLGGYNFSTDEYEFNTYKIKLSEIFAIIRNFKKEIKTIFKKKLQQFYQVEEVKDFKSMIPYTFLHTFERQTRLNVHSLKVIKNYQNLRVKNYEQ